MAQISTKFVIYSPNWQSVSPIPRGVINGKCKSSTCLMHPAAPQRAIRCVPRPHTLRGASRRADLSTQCAPALELARTMCFAHRQVSDLSHACIPQFPNVPFGMPAGLTENASLRLVSCIPQLPSAPWRARCWHYCSRWRTASNSKMAALTDTLSESSRPRIGMRMCASAASRHTCVRPVDSVPITMAVPRCMSVA